MATIEDERAARFAARQAARSHPRPENLVSTAWGRALGLAVAALALATAVGLVALWPHGAPRVSSTSAAGQSSAAATGAGSSSRPATIAATVVGASTPRCPGPADQACRRVVVRLTGGARTSITLGPVSVTAAFPVGARVRVERVDVPPGAHGVEPYALVGYDRRGTLLWAGLGCALLVLVVARGRGLLALAGLGLSLLLVVKFVVPAMLAGSPGLLVALVGAFAVMFVTVFFTYGVGGASLAACLGIGVTLALAAAGARLAAGSAHLDGRSSELSTYLAGADAKLSLTGVVLAGMVLATLGVVADMGVTQASAVMALRRASPHATARELYRRAFGIGRDHLSATTHTLVLVYAGATLPLLLVLSASGIPTADALSSQDLAEPILGTLVGAAALLVSVPLTTALTALVVARVPAGALSDGGHHHHQ